LHKGDALAGIVKLLVVGNGDPLLARLVEVLRIVKGVFGGVETELDGRRRCIIDGELEIRSAVRIGIRLEPD